MTALADEDDIGIGAATLRPSTCEFAHGGGVETLEPQVVRVLLALAKDQGRVQSRDALVESGWNGRSVSEDAINRVMSRIRRLARTTGAFDLDTVRGVGYRLRARMAAPDPVPDPGPAQETATPARAAVEPRQGARPWSWIFAGLAAAVAVAVAGVWIWAAAPPTLAVSTLASADGDHVTAQRLTSELKATLSHMHGLRLIESPAGSPPGKTDLVLDGSVEHGGGQPVVTLALHDGRSGGRIWGAVFDGRAITDPSVEERAIAAPTQFLAIWLGDRLSGQPAARDPESPEVATLVAEGRRTLRAAADARLKRRWPQFLELTKATSAVADRALAIDPRAPRALMLRFELDSWPLYPRAGETAQAFKARREEGVRSLAQALAGDPDDPEVLTAAAHQATQGMRWDDAGKLLMRAVAVDPNSADANVWYAYHLGQLGQCAQGLRYAKIAAGLQPDQVWTQMAVPRLLNCAGRQDEALAAYRALLVRDPQNVFILRDVYLWLLARRDSGGLREMVAFTRDHLWRGRPPDPIVPMLNRARAGADALDGKPRAFLSLLDADTEAIAGHNGGLSLYGRTAGDLLFPLALEYAEAGETEKGLDALRRAVEAGSLYLPWALPYGSNPFPASMRNDPRFVALWKSSSALAKLMDDRRKAAGR